MKNIFKKRWSDWTDLSVGTYSAETFLLQGRRSICGKVQFRVERSISAYGAPGINLQDLQKLIKPTENA